MVLLDFLFQNRVDLLLFLILESDFLKMSEPYNVIFYMDAMNVVHISYNYWTSQVVFTLMRDFDYLGPRYLWFARPFEFFSPLFYKEFPKPVVPLYSTFYVKTNAYCKWFYFDCSGYGDAFSNKIAAKAFKKELLEFARIKSYYLKKVHAELLTKISKKCAYDDLLGINIHDYTLYPLDLTSSKNPYYIYYKWCEENNFFPFKFSGDILNNTDSFIKYNKKVVFEGKTLNVFWKGKNKRVSISPDLSPIISPNFSPSNSSINSPSNSSINLLSSSSNKSPSNSPLIKSIVDFIVHPERHENYPIDPSANRKWYEIGWLWKKK